MIDSVIRGFYCMTVKTCIKGGCNARTYELKVLGIDDEMAMCVRKNGYMDSGRSGAFATVLYSADTMHKANSERLKCTWSFTPHDRLYNSNVLCCSDLWV